MTSYRYTIGLDDSETIALEAALRLMEEYCREQLSDGPKAPYWAYQQSVRSLLDKLRQAKGQTISKNIV
jgi:hypothetical protein